MTQDLFSLKGLRHDIAERALLDDITLTLPEGRMIGLIGHNGSGKSTLLKHLARQMQGQGELALKGRDLARWSRRDLARALAYLPQTLPQSDAMEVRELVALGRYPWHGPLRAPGRADRQAVAAALSACGLDAFADRRIDALSGGEAQRAWIAMMVAQEAQALLLDEPISALDIAHQIEVLGLLQRLTRNEGRSVVMVIHDLNMAARYCDHIVALKQGRVVFDGPVVQLMTPARLHDIYGVSMQVLSPPDLSPVAIPDIA
ncbi:ABC transporter ATP-binding protein [Thioclava kandeliae]|uniref:ABC transporter ATP-binding protein n=1 Tax=Thioclava kandeliae TaxID=3070818 RepID=A0ABV1SF08_9RHOB